MKSIRNMQNKLRNFHLGVFEKYFLSFCIMIIIPSIIFSNIIYLKLTNVMQNEAVISNDKVLNLVSKMVEERMREIEEIVYSIAVNSDIDSISISQAHDSAENMARILRIVQAFEGITSSKQYIDDVYLHLDEYAYIISSEGGPYEYEFFYSVLNHYKGLTAEQTTRILKDIKNHDNVNMKTVYNIIPTMTVEKTETRNPNKVLEVNDIITAITRFPLRGNKKASLVINIDEAELFKSIKEDTNFRGDIFISDKDHKIITHTGSNYSLTEVDKESFSSILATDRHSMMQDIGGVDTHITRLKSSYTGWDYIVLTPASVMYYELNNIKVIYMLSSFLFLIIGTFVSFFVSKRFYNPIKLIFSALSKYSKKDKAKLNEFKIIHQTVNNIIVEKDRLTAVYNDNKKLLTDRFLYKLIKGFITDEKEIIKCTLEYELPFESRMCALVLLKIDFFRHYREITSSYEKKLLYIQIKTDLINFFEDDGIVVEIENDQFCIIHFIEKLDRNKLKQKAQSIVVLLEEKYSQKMNATVAISTKSVYYKDFNNAYTHLVEQVENRIFGGNFQIIYLDEEGEIFADEDYAPVIDRQQLENALKNQDLRFCISWVGRIVKQCLENKYRQKYVSILMVDILNIVFTVIEELDGSPYDVFDKYYTLYEQLESCRTKSEIEDFFENVFIEVIKYICNRTEKEEEEKVKDVIDHINEHYNEYISLDMIAKKMNMSSSYFSKYFKSKVGENFIEYLNHVRINHAKRLLNETDITIKEIANLVGYSSTTNFNIVFKKYEGIPPSKYRSNVNH